MVDERERIYIDSDGDVHDTLNDLREENGNDRAEWTRYVRSDLCHLKKDGRLFIEKTPLFNDIFTDLRGNVWVKLPVKVKSDEQ